MELPLAIYRSSALREAGRSGATLRRRAAGDGPDRLVRVGPNAFVTGADWDAAGPRQRYVTRVFARLGRRSTAAVGSHVSAVAVHGLPWLSPWPEDVHLTVPKSQYRSGSNSLVLHTRPFGSGEVVPHGELRFTSLARTVADVALAGDARAAVVVADAALRSGATRSELVRALGGLPHHRGHATATLSLELADGRSGSPAESLARVVFRELGLPAPVLQQAFLVDGRRYDVDFWFPEQGVVIEFDGRGKYTQERYRNGRSVTEVLLDEKRRHERLLTVPGIRTIVRLEWRDLWDLDRLSQRLRAAGLPCAVRPLRSARGVRK
ncbi:hypothetical protein DEJ28_16395 [Curtobacterium sp. MCPF17_002]|uniref:hypothetical protein n=1 Tax=Curtobacterium sp. MCPF17_002 TaxID=2175645 RepID=UPI000DAA8E1C|nr:hypothetical protein [Curtobacterium sp. MCPF17_002]WIB77201.1 hypothetical protein DEJ28_16395 [Curtobacterium sp. MCPF17_002]